MTFIENDDIVNKTQVNHINSNRKDNRLSNLEWVTPKGNYDHGVKSGNMVVGVAGLFIEIPDETIHKVCELLVEGKSQVEISHITGVNISTIFSIKSEQCRRDITGQYKLPPVKKNLTDEDVLKITTDLQNLSLTNKEIEEKYALGRGVLHHIIKRKTFKHITENLEDWDKVQRSRLKSVEPK